MDGGGFVTRTARRRTMSYHVCRVCQMVFGLLALLMLMSSAAHARDVPDGWAAHAENNGTTFAPVRMNPGEKFEVWVSNALYDAPQGASLLPRIRQQAGVQGGQCEPPQATQEGVVMQNCMDGNVGLQYMLLPSLAGGGKVQLLRVRAAGSDEALARYGNGLQQVLQIVMQGQAQTMPRGEGQPQTTPRSQPQPTEKAGIAQAIRTAPGKGVQDGDIAAVYVVRQDVQNRGETVKREVHTTWLLLKDGTGYRNEIPPDELNVEASRQLQPERWVKWRKPLFGGSYEIRGPNDNDWRDLSKGKSWIARPARPGERLNSAYQHLDGWGDMYSLRIKRTAWHFNGDGTFTVSFYGHNGTLWTGPSSFNHSSTTVADSKGSNRATHMSSSSDRASLSANNSRRNVDDGASRRGRYRLNGWVLETERDNGLTVRHFVTFPDDKRKEMDIDSMVFDLCKDGRCYKE